MRLDTSRKQYNRLRDMILLLYFVTGLLDYGNGNRKRKSSKVIDPISVTHFLRVFIDTSLNSLLSLDFCCFAMTIDN